MTHSKSAGTAISNPDFKAYAESFGIKGHRPKTLAELRSTLKTCLDSKEINVVEIPVATDVNMELVNRLNKRAKGSRGLN
jgi:acetolactate synthase-1/2/3 large subunit